MLALFSLPKWIRFSKHLSISSKTIRFICRLNSGIRNRLNFFIWPFLYFKKSEVSESCWFWGYKSFCPISWKFDFETFIFHTERIITLLNTCTFNKVFGNVLMLRLFLLLKWFCFSKAFRSKNLGTSGTRGSLTWLKKTSIEVWSRRGICMRFWDGSTSNWLKIHDHIMWIHMSKLRDGSLFQTWNSGIAQNSKQPIKFLPLFG